MDKNVAMFYGASPKLFEFAKHLRHNETKAEKLLWEKLRNKQVLNMRFKRQHPILYFIADFYCHQAKLIIELDGGVHNSDEQYQYDQSRDDELAKVNLRVLRFRNDDVFENIEAVLTKITEVLKITPPVP